MLYIAVINKSTAISDAEVEAMIPAFDRQYNRDLQPVWSVDSATFAFVRSGTKPRRGAWWVVFLDNSDQADDLAYHDLTSEGLPLSKVFVKTLREDKASVSVGATHEICEMAVDPWLNGAYQGPTNIFWAGEICDPVEDDSYGYKIGGVLVTDFVTPNWFALKSTGSAIDFKGHARDAFEVLSGGYAQKYEHGRGWIQVTGEKAKRSKRATAASGSRRERRARCWSEWKRSAPSFTAASSVRARR
jgi:hypothetical protein